MFNQSWNRRELLVFVGGAALTVLTGTSRASRSPAPGGAKRSAYEQTVLDSKPAAYWRLGESQGRTAEDAAGNGFQGRYVGHPHLGQTGAITSDSNRAIGLDGPRTNSYVEIPGSDDFSIATSGKGLSVEVWMRPDALDFKGDETDAPQKYLHWLGKGEKGQFEWGFRFYRRRSERPNRISAYVWNPDGNLGAGAYVEDRLTQGAWIYLVATYDDPRKPDAQVRLYKDGVASSHNESYGTLYKSYDITPKHGPAPVRLGTRDLRGFLTGGLDEIALYPRVLEAEEIQRHWKVGQGMRG